MFDTQKNYEMFYNTIKNLSRSQGMYGRILAGINDLDDDDRTSLKQSLPHFKKPLDVVMFIEQ